MTTGYTTLLGLALPVTGDLSGQWGDTVNNYITNYLDASIAGAQTVSTDADVTLTKTTNAALDSTSSQYAVLLFSGSRTAQRTVTVPAASKIYVVINKTTGGYSVKLVGAGPTTGVTIAPGEAALVSWNGSDFVKVGGSAQFASSVSGTSIDLTLGTYFYKTIAADTTFTVTNVPASGTVSSFYLELTNAGAYTTVFWSGVKWANNAPITLSALGTDLLQFITRDGGTTWEASKIGTYGAYTLNPALNANGNIYGGGTDTLFVLSDQCAYGVDFAVSRYNTGFTANNITAATSWTYAPALRNLSQVWVNTAVLQTGAYNATAGQTVLVDNHLRTYAGTASSWIVSSQLVATWTRDGNNVTSIDYNATSAKWVVGGGSGKIAYSSDGLNWTYTSALSATAFGTSQTVVAIIATGATTIAIGASGGVGTSTDGGATWTYQAGLLTAWTSGTPVSAIYNATTGVIGVVGASGKFATTTDGVTWTNQAGLAASTWSTTSTVGGAFALTTATISSVTYFAVVSTTGIIATSVDAGVTWTANTALQTAVGGTTPQTYTRISGLYIPSSSTFASSSVVTMLSYGAQGMSAWSADGGSTWSVIGGPSQATTQFVNQKISVSPNNVVSNIAWNGTLFMAVGAYSAATSYDGVNWTPRVNGLRTKWSANNVASSTLYSVAYGAGTWVVGGYNSKVYTSTDNGATWTYQNSLFASSTTTLVNVMTYGNSRFVLAGSAGRTAYSTDNGVTWTIVASGLGAGALFSGGTFGNSKFVVGGASGNLATSPDGITWTSYTAAVTATTFGTNTIRGVAWSGTKFVVVGGTGQVLTSPDGVTWTYQGGLVTALANNPSSINAVTWTGTEFVAVGPVNTVATSSDGITWTDRTAQVPSLPGTAYGSTNNPAVPALTTLNSVVSNGNTLVIGGSTGWLINR
jgi:hypothetical protein